MPCPLEYIDVPQTVFKLVSQLVAGEYNALTLKGGAIIAKPACAG